MLKEFKQFAMRGSVLDMAVGVIIGAAFGKIVDSLVNDIIMPPIGLLLGKVDFTNLFITLKDGAVAGPYSSIATAKAAGAVTLNIGIFVNTIISFTIVTFSIFILIKAVNKMRAAGEKEKVTAAPVTKECPYCCSTISINAVKCPNCTTSLK